MWSWTLYLLLFLVALLLACFLRKGFRQLLLIRLAIWSLTFWAYGRRAKRWLNAISKLPACSTKHAISASPSPCRSHSLYSIDEQVLRSDGSWSTGRIKEICFDKVVVALEGGSVKNIPKEKMSRVLEKVEVTQMRPLQEAVLASACVSHQQVKNLVRQVSPQLEKHVCKQILNAHGRSAHSDVPGWRLFKCLQQSQAFHGELN